MGIHELINKINKRGRTNNTYTDFSHKMPFNEQCNTGRGEL